MREVTLARRIHEIALGKRGVAADTRVRLAARSVPVSDSGQVCRRISIWRKPLAALVMRYGVLNGLRHGGRKVGHVQTRSASA
jgi:hypothetical protein